MPFPKHLIIFIFGFLSDSWRDSLKFFILGIGDKPYALLNSFRKNVQRYWLSRIESGGLEMCKDELEKSLNKRCCHCFINQIRKDEIITFNGVPKKLCEECYLNYIKSISVIIPSTLYAPTGVSVHESKHLEKFEVQNGFGMRYSSRIRFIQLYWILKSDFESLSEVEKKMSLS